MPIGDYYKAYNSIVPFVPRSPAVTRTVTTTREFDADGRCIKETTIEQTHELTTHQPYPYQPIWATNGTAAKALSDAVSY